MYVCFLTISCLSVHFGSSRILSTEQNVRTYQKKKKKNYTSDPVIHVRFGQKGVRLVEKTDKLNVGVFSVPMLFLFNLAQMCLKLCRYLTALVQSQTRDGRFGSKVGHFGPKWDKSGTFSDQISVLIPYITL